MVYVLIVTILTAHGPYVREFEAGSLKHCIAAGVDMKRYYTMQWNEPVSVDCEKRTRKPYNGAQAKHALIGPLTRKGFYREQPYTAGR